MTVHKIMAPDIAEGRELRSIHWDDEAGFVWGRHSSVRHIRAVFAGPRPYPHGRMTGTAFLQDPAHDPRDFLWLIGDPALDFWPEDESTQAKLPPTLRGIPMREITPAEPVYAILPDGTKRLMVEGVDYIS